MIYRLTLDNGMRLYRTEGQMVRHINAELSGFSYCKPEESVGKMFKWYKKVKTTGEIKMSFNDGYVIGSSMPRMFRYNKQDNEAVVCFRCKEVEDRFFNIMGDRVEQVERVRHAMRVNRKDEYWFKNIVKSKWLFGAMKKAGLSPRGINGPSMMSKLSVDFKNGLFVGMFDSIGAINIQDRSKHGYCSAFVFMLDTAIMGVHNMTQRVLSGVDMEASESFSYTNGGNNNRTVLRLEYVDKHRDLMGRCCNPKIMSGLRKFDDRGERRKLWSVRVPSSKKMWLDMGKEIPKTMPRILVEQTKGWWSWMTEPDCRWARIKNVVEHHGSKF